MTTPEHEQPRRDASPDGRFEALLAESGVGLGPDDALLSALAELESLGSGNPPVPSPTLRDLLEAPDAAPLALPRRPGARRARVAIATLTVAVCLSGAGVAAAAAGNQAFRQSVGHTIASVVGTFSGYRHAVPSPSDAPPAPPAVRPSPASPASPGATGSVSTDNAEPGTSASGNPDRLRIVRTPPAILPSRVDRLSSPAPLPPTASAVPSAAHDPRAGAVPSSHAPAPGRSASPRDPHPTGSGQTRP